MIKGETNVEGRRTKRKPQVLEVRHVASEGGLLCRDCRTELLPTGLRRLRLRRYAPEAIVVIWDRDPFASWATNDARPSKERPFCVEI
jgi:hypothetical protein